MNRILTSEQRAKQKRYILLSRECTAVSLAVFILGMLLLRRAWNDWYMALLGAGSLLSLGSIAFWRCVACKSGFGRRRTVPKYCPNCGVPLLYSAPTTPPNEW
jgi:hypothetical protein